MNSPAKITTELAVTCEYQLVGGLVCLLLKELFPEQADNFHDSVYVAGVLGSGLVLQHHRHYSSQ